MSGEKKPYCPKCKLRWKTVEMDPDRGSWTLRNLLRCPDCGLVDYPGEEGARRYGPVIWR